MKREATDHSALFSNIPSMQSSKGVEFRSVILTALAQIESSGARTHR